MESSILVCFLDAIDTTGDTSGLEMGGIGKEMVSRWLTHRTAWTGDGIYYVKIAPGQPDCWTGGCFTLNQTVERHDYDQDNHIERRVNTTHIMDIHVASCLSMADQHDHHVAFNLNTQDHSTVTQRKEKISCHKPKPALLSSSIQYRACMPLR